ncbi:MAG: hypothetical protein QOD42_3328 [Sphingomonadales bacterium]|jgi:hypothetical protein|nr:hypothetical protein [Sphingomonadales bacterium]
MTTSMGRFGLRACMLGLIAPLAAAAAEPEIGSRLDAAPRGAVTPEEREDQATARRVMRTYAACLSRARPRTAAAVLAAPYGDEEQLAAVRRRVQGVDDCMGRGMSMGFRPTTLAGALAEAGLRARFATADLAPAAALADEDIARLGLTPRNGYEELAACIARRDPQAVRALVLTEPATPEERVARRAIAPGIGPCVNQGQSLRVDMGGLRAMLAVALYRMLDALPPPPAARRN